ncbi:PP2C family protein-serine/threonine phosphatase [Deferribacter abyssi]|uniref:PP2C family protein-serine/threonine phosphatase n=1 Tax=Deferribacter abyssi TaxID=213806 RepID=UPI003C229B23
MSFFDLKSLVTLYEAESLNVFIQGFLGFLKKHNINKFIIFKVEGVIAKPIVNYGVKFHSFIDLSDIAGDFVVLQDVRLSVFDEVLEASIVINLKYKNNLFYTVFIQEKLDSEVVNYLEIVIPSIGRKVYELVASDERLKAFIGYQQKIEFIKKAKNVLGLLEENEILSKSLIYFMDTFSAEASFLMKGDEYEFIGLEKSVLDEILIEDKTLRNYIDQTFDTVFIEGGVFSNKYHIDNIFLIPIESENVKICLFNIKYDFIPDKEFAELISLILKIALENARRMKEILKYKLEEQEINHTIEILNKFSKQQINYEDENIIVSGINIPAKMAGGDYLEFRKIDDDYYFALADVCGKGYSASILTVVLSTFSDLAFEKDEFVKKLIKLNKFLCEKNLDGKFITAFIAYFDRLNSCLYYQSFGHEPVYLLKGNVVVELNSEYLPFGIFEEEYIVNKISIDPGDILFIYSDGIVEYIQYDKIKSKLKNNRKYEKRFVFDLYNELVQNKNTQRDDFTCMYTYFK